MPDLSSHVGESELAYDEKVLRTFVRDGRLIAIPAQERKRVVVLRFLLERCFPDDRVYREPEVNERLAEYHEDVAALRRYLVVAGLMARAGGEYHTFAPGEPRVAEGAANLPPQG